MKYCKMCRYPLSDDTVMCPHCGYIFEANEMQPEIMQQADAYLKNTYNKEGKQVKDGVSPAPAYQQSYTQSAPYTVPQQNTFLQEAYAVVTKLSERLKTSAIIWIVVGSIQVLIGLLGSWFPTIVGILNIISAVKDIQYSKTILTTPVGITGKFEPLTGPIITLVCNFLLGGMIGVIGSIYYFTSIRSFVLSNKKLLKDLESAHIGQM